MAATAWTRLVTFGRGGIHPGAHKEATAGKPIEDLPAPSEVRLPLSQHIGAPATPIVKKGEFVRRGQLVATGDVPLHATIDGKVKPLDKYPHPSLVIAPAIVIARAELPEGDAAPPPLSFDEDPAWRECPAETVLARIAAAGIVGLGGAAYPTARKLAAARDSRIDTLILNAAECEPYLTSDSRTLLAMPRDVLEGAAILARLTGARQILIGLEADKQDAAAALRAALDAAPLEGCEVSIVGCHVRYPQGAERQLVQALTGRVLAARALPMSVGVLVQNVATAVAVHDAVRYQKPLLDRIVTVTGPGVREPKNVRVPLGTLLDALVDFCGGVTDDARRLIAGGPMMGRTLPRLDVPVVKGLNGLVVLTGDAAAADGFQACIACGRCLDACPLGLEPDQVSIRVEAGRALETPPFGVAECYECGCCSYVCPSARPLVQFMQLAKSALRRHAETVAAS